jgi:hypothetical protein
MLPSKSTKIFSEMNDFFTSSEKAIKKCLSVMNALKLTSEKIPNRNNWPVCYRRADLLNTLLLFPFFSIEKVPGYLENALFEYMKAAKDTIYRFKNESGVAWRELVYKVNGKILKRINKSGSIDSTSYRCLILDDTDIRKTGKFIEHISRIWSHSLNCGMIGFKGLFLGYWDSKTFIGLDFSLHKEKGKNKKYPCGFKQSVLKKQYKKKRNKESHGYAREKELHQDKISNAIRMIERARQNNIPFEYVLMDSWFFCQSIMNTVIEMGAHIIGMAKMGKSNYLYKGKNRSAKQIVDGLRKTKKIKWVKSINLYVIDTVVKFKGVPVKLYFCRNTRRGKWHLIISTNTSLTIKQAYEIYAIRWSIEVFFKEMKQHFQLGKSQSRDFDAQIADTSISMMQYNIFNLAKRFSSYETLGELFKDAQGSVMELTICKRLWLCFIEFVAIISDICDVDPDDLMEKIFAEKSTDNKFAKMIKFEQHFAA